MLVLKQITHWKGGTIIMTQSTHESKTLEALEQEFIDLGKFRPEFLVVGLGAGNHPHARNAGDIALGAVNMARQCRSQDGWSSVQIKRWSTVASHYVLDTKYQDQAFPAVSEDELADSDGDDLATRRYKKSSLHQFSLVVEKARKSEAFDIDSRQYLIEQFMLAFGKIGGDPSEVADYIG